MKAPDKIYVRPSAFTPPWPSAIDENDKYGGLEYIRKDAILEWAKKELETRRNTGMDYFLPAIVVLNDLIDKLNPM